MSNTIEWNGYTFDDGNISNGSISLHIEKSLLGDELSADTLSFIAFKSDQTSGALKSLTSYLQSSQGHALFCYTSSQGVDFSGWQYGQAVNIYHDDSLMAKMYLKNIERVARNAYKFNCISAMGLLINRQHKGGIYSGTSGHTIGTICAEILSGISYTIDADIAAEKVNGRLKIASCRDNLRDLMFAYGGSVLKGQNGNLHITYNSPQSVTNIPQGSIYIGGEINYLAPATKVVLTEHQYTASDTVDYETLYTTSTAVSNVTIIFDEAIQTDSIQHQGFDIIAMNPNYMTVSGTGTITGRPYLHTQKQLTKDTGVTADENIVEITDALLVNTLNSANCLERIRKYYSTVNEVSCDIKLTNGNILPGSKVSFTDPFGEAKEGFIYAMDIIFSTIMKASSKIAVGWVPGPFGNNLGNVRTFTEADISGGVLTFPSAMVGKQATVVLIGGGDGGSGGGSGQGGADGGNGGSGGAYGNSGNVNQFTITIPSSISASIGAGGAGGSAGSQGSSGGATTFGAYSSANGMHYDFPYTEMITGTQYAFNGSNGVDGGFGATSATGYPYQGGSVTFGGQTWVGGEWNRGNESWIGGAGSGAAVGANGNRGGDGYITTTFYDKYYHGGNGASGATATIAGANATVRGSGGSGGHGGGGGAEGGNGLKDIKVKGGYGSGGSGSAGGNGMPGIIIVLY